MLKNLIIVSLRNLKRNKGYTALNILGLAMAISISLLAIIKVEKEFSYEKGFKDYKRIFRLNQDLYVSDQHMEAAVTPGAMAKPLVEIFPEIENYVRLERGGASINYQNIDHDIRSLVKADTMIFNFFGITLIEMQGNHPLGESNSIAISKSTAQRIFGKTNPLGESISVSVIGDFMVTAVFEDLPQNTHLRIDVVVDIEKHSQSSSVSSWYDSGIFTYLKLKENTNVQDLEEKINLYMAEKTADIREKTAWQSVFSLMPVENIRLYSHRIGDSGGGSISHIIALLLVAIIVVTLAAVNYTNLSVALTNRRAHEVGMRKVAGSPKFMVITQFLVESVILSLIAYLIALPIAEVSMGAFASITGEPLSFSILKNFNITIIFFGFAVLLGILSGAYPAFILSSFNPLKVIRKGNGGHKAKTLFRNIIIVAQFAAGLSLIIVTVIVFQQRKYLMEQSKGIDKENAIIISTRNLDGYSSLNSIKDELQSVSGIVAVSVTNSNPPQDFSASNYTPEDYPDDGAMIITRMEGDCDFLVSLGAELQYGRHFNNALPSDSLSVIINETLARRMGWKNPIGKRIWKDKELDANPLTVIGVVADFHFESMHTPIKPLVILMNTTNASNIIVRLDPKRKTEAIEDIKKRWESITNGKTLTYKFIDDNYKMLYKSEEGLSKGFVVLTIIAIIIACLGLVGLAAYSANQQVKEIGIRKVMGASTLRLLTMLWWNFIRLVGIAILLAWPLAYLLIKQWLSNFAYRIEISPWVFVFTAFAGIVVAVLSVGSITYNAARQNPAQSLKFE